MEKEMVISKEKKTNFFKDIVKNKKKEIISLFTILSFLGTGDFKDNSYINIGPSQANAESVGVVNSGYDMLDGDIILEEETTDIPETTLDNKEKIPKIDGESIETKGYKMTIEEEKNFYLTQALFQLAKQYNKSGKFIRAIELVEEGMEKLQPLADKYYNRIVVTYAYGLNTLASSRAMLLLHGVLGKDIDTIEITNEEDWNKYIATEFTKIFDKNEIHEMYIIIDIVKTALDTYDYCKKNADSLETRMYILKDEINVLVPLLIIGKYISYPGKTTTDYEKIFAGMEINKKHIFNNYVYFLEKDTYPVRKSDGK